MPLPFSVIFHLITLLLLGVSLSHALPVPDPAPIQLRPAASTSSVAEATIPAFPEQSDVASSACPLDLPADLLPSVTAACASGSGHLLVPSRPHCCPALAAWLYAAFSPTALAARPLPDAGYDLPALPDDSEACAAGAERAVRARGLELPRKNATCDAAYCYCGVRLRRLACTGGFAADPNAEGRWVPAGGGARRLEEDCTGAGLTGCSRCLRSLNQLKDNSSRSSGGTADRGDRECQLMGVMWLLYRNRTLYLPTATAVLRALMAADAAGSPDPSYCELSQDAMPLAVGSNQIDVHETSSAALSTLFHLPLTLLLCIIFLL
ncbi:uncharacterized GPI-anchored protein At4g28100-like [Zingiber officinale]|uniref:SPARK domain-containing protein n=1 Tax=Zingiber officinale TaxID=94328 RepID=A0A8J5L9P0_ZINOF|nr:uncharacterized GPI-anchored protein At4g28100-like [Zingiber officinale]KAG6510854.1 hypothetical protein ZIOFF_028899 [Zingiber officinale]